MYGMNFMSVFPFLTGILEFGAAIVYLQNKQYALALTWGFYGMAAIALGSVR